MTETLSIVYVVFCADHSNYEICRIFKNSESAKKYLQEKQAKDFKEYEEYVSYWKDNITFKEYVSVFGEHQIVEFEVFS